MENLLERLDEIAKKHPKFILWFRPNKDGERDIYCLDFKRREDRALKLHSLPDIKERTEVYLFHYQEKLLLKTKAGAKNLLISEAKSKVISLDQEQADILLASTLGTLEQTYPMSDYKKAKDYYFISGFDEKKLPKNLVLNTRRERTSKDHVLLTQEVGDLTIDEEEKKFLGQRGTPRARPKKGKMVTVKKKLGADNHTYPLYDLSMGGLAFLCPEESLFEVDSELEILSFDKKNFEDPMIAIIRVIKELTELQGQFKVGVQFIQ